MRPRSADSAGGRERRPSLQVLRALALALRLDAHATAYLISLDHPLATSDRATTTGSAGVRLLLDHGLRASSFAVDVGLNILAINAAGRAMHSVFADVDNLARMVFLDPAARDFYPDWHRVATQVIGNLGSGPARFSSDDRVAEVVEEIYSQRLVFTELWATHHIRPRPSEDKSAYGIAPCPRALLSFYADTVRELLGVKARNLLMGNSF